MLGAQPLAREAGKTYTHVISRISNLRIFICHAKFGETKMASTKRAWSTQDVRDLVQKRFKKRPCYFQIKVSQALYTGKDVVACAPTGAGKTLTFWIPILMALEEGEDKMSIFIAWKVTQSRFNPVMLIEPFWSKLSSRVSTPPFKKDVESGLSRDMAVITKDSIVRFVECKASSINLTVSCCKLDILLFFFVLIIRSSAICFRDSM